MRGSTHIIAFLLVALAASMPMPLHADSALYVGMTLVDPIQRRQVPNTYIFVEDGVITSMGVGRPPRKLRRSRVHDFTGRYALPGFIDAHAHVTIGPMKVTYNDGAPSISFVSDDAISEHYGKTALAFGVTTIRNPGGDPAANARYDQMIASGKWLGPEALHAGSVIEPPPFGGESFAYPRTEEQWQAEAARQAGLGMRYFKLYTGLTEQEIATGIRVAHEHGLKAIGHLNTVSWTRAIQLGIDGVEHALPTSADLLEPAQRAQYLSELGPNSMFMYRWFELADLDGPLIREMVELLVRRRVAVNLTLVVNDIIYHADDLERAVPSDSRQYEHAATLDSMLEVLQASMTGWTSEDYRRARAVMPKVLKFARLLHEAGAAMMIGTDGHGGSPYYARELALHVQAGIPTWDVLRMATSDAAHILGIANRTGRLAEGYEADIVILSADPLADVTNVSKVHAVVNDGSLLTPSELLPWRNQ